MSSTTNRITQLLGSRGEHYENLIVAGCMFIITAGYEYISYLLLPGFQLNWFEFIGTWSGLTTVWLARTENILCWPWGIVSAASLGYFFAQIGLMGQQWLNLGYFLIIQIYAWPYWAFGGKNATELPVTRLTGAGRFWTSVALVAGIGLVYSVISLIAPDSHYPILDATVVSSSVVAQWLLGRKKIESWYLWLGPVNVLSIALFLLSGAYVVMALYIAFLIHAVFAIRSWRQTLVVTHV